ncbi:MAG: nitrogen regulation protein NR(II) [Gammaproteobacteria bacterium]|nr:nitrogen regulation protein NR(II) [Gammaproteobacteria bacterium]
MSSLLSINSLNTAVMLLKTDYKIIDLNDSAAQLLMRSRKSLIGHNLFELIQSEWDQQRLNLLIERNQSTFIEEAHLIVHNQSLLCNLFLSTFEEDGNQFLLLEIQTGEHHSHIRKDIELQHQSRISNHLIRNLAHEIKNPLGGIKGAAQLLQRKFADESFKKYSQIIIQETDRLGDLVDRLLLPAKIEDKSHCNVHQLIDKALDLILLNYPDLQIIRDYDPSLPDLFISVGQIQQALLNLIKNAAEAVQPDGEIILKTRVQLQQTIGEVQYKKVMRIDVIDTGEGIPEAIIKDIFFPTISGKNSSGLGLSIAQSLVQRHDGIIELDKQHIHTCFSVYLPIKEQ